MPFKKSVLKWRVGPTTKDKKKGMALAYVDARDVIARLNEVLGIGGWQCRYPYSGCCEIGILCPETSQWIWKANCSGTTDIEKEKGEASSAFKRAAVLWGISFYLYKLEVKWVEIESFGNSHKIKTPPELPKWATPEGYLEIINKKNGKAE